MMESHKMWIDGRWVSSVSGKVYTVVNPATEKEIALVPKGDERDVDMAVKAARKAFPVWSKKSQAERTGIVIKIAEMLRDQAKDFAQIDVLDHGTPINMAYMMVQLTISSLEFNAQVSRALMGSVIPMDSNNLHYLKREPVGVCALIIPWNMPMVTFAMKLGAALSTGNTCVVKPPSVDSLAILKFAEILEKTGLPEGTVNIVTGPGDITGNALARHPDVNLISFTGSSETGKAIMTAGSQTIKKMIMELGGKNPFIVLDDADLEKTAKKAVMSSYFNSGMVCSSPGRYYIPETEYDKFVELFVANAKRWAVGDPMDAKTMMGPLVSAEHRDRVERYIKSGLDEGARLVLGGERPNESPLNKGYYVIPTVFADVTQDMTIAREEIFGPVTCLIRYSSEEEALAMANDSAFGLCASVWTQNLAKATHFANELQAGTVCVNNHIGPPAEIPWGGFKQSGIGKENGVIGLEEYTQMKVVAINLV